MAAALFIDFGSTYTKVAVVDLDEARLTLVASGSQHRGYRRIRGLSRALKLLKSRSKLQEEEVTVKLACSSAAGGLHMIAVGLIPHLTAEAANRATLGASAKVIKVYGKELNDRTVPELEALNPDIILLAGGIDGGNRDVIVRNARRIANSQVKSPMIVAGNADTQEEVAALFQQASQETFLCDNVMPGLDELVVEPARASEYIGQVIMPTPLAVLTMANVLASYVNPFSLRPKSPNLYTNQYNVLYARGFLATLDRDKVLRLLKSSLRPMDRSNEAG